MTEYQKCSECGKPMIGIMPTSFLSPVREICDECDDPENP